MDHTGRSGYNQLWVNQESQDLTVWLWTEISKHYMNNGTIAAYDFLNEPWGGTEADLKQLVERCYHAVRGNDDAHIVIFPGHYSGIDFYRDDQIISFSNVMYTMHFYPGFFGWGAPVPQVHADFLANGLKEWKDRMQEFDAPLLIGEFNVVSKRAGGGEMMRRYFDLYGDNGWPATMWSYKVLTYQGGIGEMNWGMVTNDKPLKNLDLYSDSKSEIETWFSNLSKMDYAVHVDLQKWLITTDKPSSLDDLPPLPPPIKKAPESDPLPEGWTATDIGDPISGGQLVNDSQIIVYGGGADIWTDNDQFRFIWTKISGDFTITTTIRELLNTNSYAKAGLMARTSLDINSAHALINVFPFGNTEFGSRDETGSMMQALSGPSTEINNTVLRLTRKHNVISGSVLISDEWMDVGEIKFDNLNSTLFVGIATLSHDNSRLTRAVYETPKISQE
ncbi:MAG: glycoside hydrolase family 5 protein [Fidelibacterota bacterium]